MQCESPGSPWHKKARVTTSKVMTMLICFFACKGIVHRQSVIQTFYLVLQHLRQQFRDMRSELFPGKRILYHATRADTHRFP